MQLTFAQKLNQKKRIEAGLELPPPQKNKRNRESKCSSLLFKFFQNRFYLQRRYYKIYEKIRAGNPPKLVREVRTALGNLFVFGGGKYTYPFAQTPQGKFEMAVRIDRVVSPKGKKKGRPKKCLANMIGRKPGLKAKNKEGSFIPKETRFKEDAIRDGINNLIQAGLLGRLMIPIYEDDLMVGSEVYYYFPEEAMRVPYGMDIQIYPRDPQRTFRSIKYEADQIQKRWTHRIKDRQIRDGIISEIYDLVESKYGREAVDNIKVKRASRVRTLRPYSPDYINKEESLLIEKKENILIPSIKDKDIEGIKIEEKEEEKETDKSVSKDATSSEENISSLNRSESSLSRNHTLTFEDEYGVRKEVNIYQQNNLPEKDVIPEKEEIHLVHDPIPEKRQKVHRGKFFWKGGTPDSVGNPLNGSINHSALRKEGEKNGQIED